MLTENNFFLKFEKYNAQELIKIKNNQADYSREAINALNKLIDLRGGIIKISDEAEEIKKTQIETVRILLETEKQYHQKKDIETIKKSIQSNIINKGKVDEIIISEFTRLETQKDNFDLNPKSVLNLIAGILISSFIGACLFCFFMICSENLFFLITFAMIFISYFNLKFFTELKKINGILILATIVVRDHHKFKQKIAIATVIIQKFIFI